MIFPSLKTEYMSRLQQTARVLHVSNHWLVFFTLFKRGETVFRLQLEREGIACKRSVRLSGRNHRQYIINITLT